jgi:acetolactate synthase-1/2/3 large subunit
VDGAGLAALRQALAQARRPLLIVSGLDYLPEEHEALAHWARAAACPVLTTPSALGVVPDACGTFLNGLLERPLLERADLIVTVNLDAHDFFNTPWRSSAPVMSISPEPDTHRFVPRARGLIADAGPLFEALLPDATRSEWEPAELSAYAASLRERLAAPPDTLTVVSALDAARAVLPEDTLLAVDAGFGKPLTSYLWRPGSAGAYFSSHGLSSMGYAIPAANALKLCQPERTVVGLMGDGSLLMRATEIGSAVDLGIAPIYVAWMDESLTQIEMKQRQAGLRPVGARLSAPDCAGLARSLGARGVDVASLEDFSRALRDAVTSPVPTLIGAHVDASRHPDWYSLIR